MLAERFQSSGRRRYQTLDETFHVIFLFLEDLDINHVAGNGEFHKDDRTVHTGQSFAFGGYGFDRHIFQDQVGFFLRHAIGEQAKMPYSSVCISKYTVFSAISLFNP